MAKQIARTMIFLNNEPTNFYAEVEIENGTRTVYLVNMLGKRLGLQRDFHLGLENGKWVAISKRIISE